MEKWSHILRLPHSVISDPKHLCNRLGLNIATDLLLAEQISEMALTLLGQQQFVQCHYKNQILEVMDDEQKRQIYAYLLNNPLNFDAISVLVSKKSQSVKIWWQQVKNALFDYKFIDSYLFENDSESLVVYKRILELSQ
ncbi:Hypothetical_protein [Hexamita inflata]|uniref:Hypothetical_protein n=1 Tax=Hexamita inflata TaxID=28002 RepID=A0ABP1KH45_9EUKA